MVASLKIFEVLEAHLSEDQARTVTHAIQQAESDIAMDVKSVVEEAFARCIDRCATKAQLAEAKAGMIKWMFVFWIGQVGATVAIVKWLR